MKIINVGSRSFLTGNEIADAIMTCAKELWSARRVELATIPFLTDHGERRRTQFLIGWESALSTVTIPYDGAELHDDDTVAELHRQAKPALSPRIESGDTFSDLPDPEYFSFEFDEL